MNKQKLATKIWESANKMRSKIEANEYKDYILGFIFYKYLSDKEVSFMRMKGATKYDIECLSEEDSDIVKYIQDNIGYFISYKNLFSTWLTIGKNFDVSNVRDALFAFRRFIDCNHRKVFDGIFDTLQMGLSKLGESSAAQTKAISDLLQLIKDIPMNGKEDYDVLGFIYEYLISNFAANAGKKAGEFYTPYEVSILISEIIADHLKERKEIQIYDSTSGSGSLLINIGRSLSKHIGNDDNIKYYAQELKQNTYNLTRMNLIMRGILQSNIITRNGDTLEDDWPYFEDDDSKNTYKPIYVDAVVSNPPYSQNWDPEGKENDPRYSCFGLAPKCKADYAFLLHDLYHTKEDGIMTIVLPHGVLFRGGEEGTIRKNLIENNNIDIIIGLPSNIFFGTGIPTIIMVLKQKRENKDLLIIDASRGFIKEGKNNKLQASDIKRIIDTISARKEVDKFSRLVNINEIRDNGYNLNISRYINSFEVLENWDIYSCMFGGIPKNEIDDFHEYWRVFPDLKKDLFIKVSEQNFKIVDGNIKDIIKKHPNVISFEEKCKKIFHDFDVMLYNRIIKNMKTLNISKEENIISQEIFKRLKSIPLADEYKVYQIFYNEWVNISFDIEIIQLEGFEVIKKVDFNLVIKKKNGKNVEVKDGYIGRIIPFNLVQETLLAEEFKNLKSKESILRYIVFKQQEIFDSLTEEDKENLSSVLNNDNTAFVSCSLLQSYEKLFKGHSILKYDRDSIERKILLTMLLHRKERELKKIIKLNTDKLHLLTKEIIENLSKEEIYFLLKLKWINPLMSKLDELSVVIIDNFIKQICDIIDKYRVTLSDIEEKIKYTEEKISLMIENLMGNDMDMKGLIEFKRLLGGN